MRRGVWAGRAARCLGADGSDRLKPVTAGDAGAGHPAERAVRHVPSGPVSTVSGHAAVDRVADGCNRGVVRLLGRRRARRRSA